MSSKDSVIICPHPIKWISKDNTKIYCEECKQEFAMPVSTPEDHPLEIREDVRYKRRFKIDFI